jgi:hypothetical protein
VFFYFADEPSGLPASNRSTQCRSVLTAMAQVPAPVSRAGRSRQFGRASAPMIPHLVHTIRGAECWHWHVISPAVGAQDRPVVAQPAAHVQRPHAVGAHVAEGHRRASLRSWSCAHSGEDTMAAFGESCRHCGHVLVSPNDPRREIGPCTDTYR